MVLTYVLSEGPVVGGVRERVRRPLLEQTAGSLVDLNLQHIQCRTPTEIQLYFRRQVSIHLVELVCIKCENIH